MFALAAPASAKEKRAPGSVQDPPGAVRVDQPAGVGFSERGTQHDSTHPMYGPTYGDIQAEGQTPVEKPIVIGAEPAWISGANESKRDLVPGRDVRTSFDEPNATVSTGTGITDTAHGTDLGYGTGTE
jgi:hypothetical protein